MLCVHCGAWTTVASTRAHGKYVLKRARRCANGCALFQTYEVIGTSFTRLKQSLAFAHRAAEKRAILWRRNQQILRRLQAGEPGASIAADLGLSPSSVSLVLRKNNSQVRSKSTGDGRIPTP